jgi:ParB-like chromosome segregation protein Spo0J
MLRDLSVEQIERRADARSVDPGTVLGLAESIAAVGLINPIRVRASGEGWEVIAGAHRFEACKSLGLAEIACDVVTDDDLHAELAMIDENLCRAELSPSDRARQTARRKAIYLLIHPETQQGVAQAAGMNAALERGGQLGHDVDRFDEDTAKVSGQSERAVRRDAERGEKVIDEVLDLIRGTKLDTGTYLDKLKKLPGSEQFVVAKRDLAALRQAARQSEQTKTSGINRSKLDADIRHRADRANAELLAEYLPAECWDHFKSNAAVGSLKGMLVEFANFTGQSIMDRMAS